MKIKMSHVGLLDLFNTATPARLPKIVMKSTTKVIVVADMFPCSIGTRDCRRARRASRRGPRIPLPARTGIPSRYVRPYNRTIHFFFRKTTFYTNYQKLTQHSNFLGPVAFQHPRVCLTHIIHTMTQTKNLDRP